MLKIGRGDFFSGLNMGGVYQVSVTLNIQNVRLQRSVSTTRYAKSPPNNAPPPKNWPRPFNNPLKQNADFANGLCPCDLTGLAPLVHTPSSCIHFGCHLSYSRLYFPPPPCILRCLMPALFAPRRNSCLCHLFVSFTQSVKLTIAYHVSSQSVRIGYTSKMMMVHHGTCHCHNCD